LRTTWPAVPSGSSARPSSVTRTPPAFPKLRRKPSRASNSRRVPRRIRPEKMRCPSAETSVQESWSNSRTSRTPDVGAGLASGGADSLGAGLLAGAGAGAGETDVLEGHGRHRPGRGGGRSRAPFRADDQARDEEHRGDDRDDRSGGAAAAAQEARAHPALPGSGLLRPVRGDVGEIGVDHLVQIEPQVAGVRADEPPGEHGRRELPDVARLEGGEEADGDLRGGRDLLERDAPDEPLPAEFFPEREGRCLTHALTPPVIGGLPS